MKKFITAAAIAAIAVGALAAPASASDADDTAKAVQCAEETIVENSAFKTEWRSLAKATIAEYGTFVRKAKTVENAYDRANKAKGRKRATLLAEADAVYARVSPELPMAAFAQGPAQASLQAREMAHTSWQCSTASYATYLTPLPGDVQMRLDRSRKANSDFFHEYAHHSTGIGKKLEEAERAWLASYHAIKAKAGVA